MIQKLLYLIVIGFYICGGVFLMSLQFSTYANTNPKVENDAGGQITPINKNEEYKDESFVIDVNSSKKIITPILSFSPSEEKPYPFLKINSKKYKLEKNIDPDTLPKNGITPNTILTKNGTLTLKSNFAVIYTPDKDYVGKETITYTDLENNTYTISIDITNTAPIARDDAVAIPFIEETSFNVLLNDTDAETDALILSEINGEEIEEDELNSIRIPCGELLYDTRKESDYENGEIGIYPYFYYSGPCSFRYTIEDEQGENDTALVILHIATTPPDNDTSITTRKKQLPDKQSYQYETTIINHGPGYAIFPKYVFDTFETGEITSVSCSSSIDALCPSRIEELQETGSIYIPYIGYNSTITVTLNLQSQKDPRILSELQPSSFYYDYNIKNNRVLIPRISPPPEIVLSATSETNTITQWMLEITSNSKNQSLEFETSLPLDGLGNYILNSLECSTPTHSLECSFDPALLRIIFKGKLRYSETAFISFKTNLPSGDGDISARAEVKTNLFTNDGDELKLSVESNTIYIKHKQNEKSFIESIIFSPFRAGMIALFLINTISIVYAILRGGNE